MEYAVYYLARGVWIRTTRNYTTRDVAMAEIVKFEAAGYETIFHVKQPDERGIPRIF